MSRIGIGIGIGNCKNNPMNLCRRAGGQKPIFALLGAREVLALLAAVVTVMLLVTRCVTVG